MDISNKILQLITENIQVFKINIIDESYKHANHKKDTKGGHYKLLVVSNNFKGMSLLKRHQSIYQILDNMMKVDIHALSKKILTEEEYNNSK